MSPFARRSFAPLVVRVVLVLVAIAGLGLWIFFKWRASESSPADTASRGGPNSQAGFVDPELMKKFLAVEAQRNAVDHAVWAKEILAERHEEVFIRLWDNLRTNENEFAVLENFPFGELFIGKSGPSTNHEHRIKSARLAGSGERLTLAQWRQQLAKWKSQGYRVEQTEWRHPRFDPGPPAKSVIYLVAHVINPARPTRHILRGNLNVEWDSGSEPGDAPVPRRIEATGLELVERTGEPAFPGAVSRPVEPESGTIFIDPLILYDLDGDGLSEIVLGCKNEVFWNRGNGRFDRSVLCPQLRGLVGAAVIADFDGDGNADFLAADRSGLILFSGDQAGKFPGPGRRSWPSPEPLLNPFVMTAGDVDGDSDLDLWLAQYKLPYVAGQMPTPYYDANDGFPSFLLVNDGQGNFRDATEQSGLAAKRLRRTYSNSLVDLDDDGDLDLLVVSDFSGVDVHYNDGRGHFTDVTSTLLEENHAFGMAHAFGDYDLDGKLDFFVIGMNSFVAERLDALKLGPPEFPDYQAMRPKMAYGNRMFFARGKKFDQTALSDQVARSGWSWGATSFDFDNDGDLDLYIANGHKSRASAKDYETQFWRHDIYLAPSEHDPVLDLYFRATADRLYGAGQSYGGYEKNRLYLNQSGKSFLEIGYLMGVAIEEDCRNVAADDLDGDGKLDLLMATFEEWPQPRQGLHLLQNRVEQSGNWIGIRLREGGGGYSPVGAKVVLHLPSGRQLRWLVTGDSYRSQHANTAHFGLGHISNVDSVEIVWVAGKVQRILLPAINRYYDIRTDGR